MATTRLRRMDVPPIQYARTDDGVNIAYWTLGERTNPALIVVPPGVKHLALEWEFEGTQAWYERLARRFFVVAYDARGSGMSQRGVADLAQVRFVADLGTVTAAVGLRQYALLSVARGAMVCIAHAVERPETVTHLVFWGPLSRGRDTAEGRPTGDPRQADWETFRRMMGMSAAGFSRPDLGTQVAAMYATSTSAEEWQALADEADRWDVRELLPRVQADTLIFGLDGWRAAPLSVAQDVAAAIPNAQLVLVHEDTAYIQFGDRETYAAAIEALVFGEETEQDEAFPAGLRTLLFTDLESSTALTQAVGDEKAQEILRGHNDAVRTALEAHGGEEVKHTGDGIMAAFGSAVGAVEAALQIQRELAGAEVRVRVGLNAGEPIAEDDDYFGAAVQLAARVCDRAEPGQVLVSNVVRELCTGKLFHFEDQGEATLKGFPEPVRLFTLRLG